MGAQLPRDDNTPMQVFTPHPKFTKSLTVPAGGSVTWTIGNTAGERESAFTFDPAVPVKVKLNANSNGHRFAANPDQPYGAFGISAQTTQIVFTDTGASGGVVIVEAM